MQAISFYKDNINPLVLEYQRKVFAHFGMHVDQFKYGGRHGDAIDMYLRYHEWDNIAIFDIDCIPLHAEVLNHAEVQIDAGWLYGAAQKANHIPDSQVYCSPAFCCFTKEAYERAGKPTFCETQWHDVGSHFTNEMVRVGHRAKLLWPTHVENPIWELKGDIKFGHGTTYGKIHTSWLPPDLEEDAIYHAFESRFNHESTSRFIEKCKQILGEA